MSTQNEDPSNPSNVISLDDHRAVVATKKRRKLPVKRPPPNRADTEAMMKYVIECYSDVIKLACVSLHEIESGIAKDPKESARVTLLTITKIVNQVMKEMKLPG